jgi:hypothetical protein
VVFVAGSNVQGNVALAKTLLSAALSVLAMASEDELKLPLLPWLFGVLQRNPPNTDVDRAELELMRIQSDVILCLREIGEERMRRTRSMNNHRVAVAQVGLIN